MTDTFRSYSFGLTYPDAAPLTRREAGAALNALAKEIQHATAVPYDVAIGLACEEREDLKRAYALDLTPTHATYVPPAPAPAADALQRLREKYAKRVPEGGTLGAIRRDILDARTPAELVDAVVKLEMHQDPDLSYQAALRRVLERDPDLKAAYARS